MYLFAYTAYIIPFFSAQSFSVLEIWGAEYQENNAFLTHSTDTAASRDIVGIDVIQRIAQRENCTVSVVGEVTGMLISMHYFICCFHYYKLEALTLLVVPAYCTLKCSNRNLLLFLSLLQVMAALS